MCTSAKAATTFFDYDGVTYRLDDGVVSVYGCPTGHFSGDVIIPATVEYQSVVYHVTKISAGAFSNSTDLTRLILPETLTNVSHTVFANCNALKVLQLNCIDPPVVDLDEDGGFPDIKYTCKLVVPTNSIELYLNATGWNEFVNIVPLMPKYDGTNCYNGVINHYPLVGQFYSPIINKQFPLYISNGNLTMTVGIGGSVSFDNVECRAILGMDIISDTPLQSYPKANASAESMDITLPPLSWDGIYALLFFRNNEVVGVCYVAQRGKLVDDLLYYTYNTYSNEATIIKYGGTYTSRPSALKIPEAVELSNDNVKKSFKVVKIFDEALSYYNTLESIEIPNTITYVGLNAFKGCSKLADITIVDGDKALNLSSSLSTSGQQQPALIDCPIQNVYMGRSLYSGTFKNQSKLKSVVIGDSVTYLPSSIFYDCYSLTDLTMGRSIKSISEDAFNGCSSLEKIDLSTGLTKIGQRAFANCKSLKALILPETITELGTNSNGPVNPNYIFSGCTALKDIICLYAPSVGKPIVPNNTKIFTPMPSLYGWGTSVISMEKTEYEYSGGEPSLEFAFHCDDETIEMYNLTYVISFPPLSSDGKIPNFNNVGTHSLQSYVTLFYNYGETMYEHPLLFQITPAPLKIKAPNLSREYGKPNPVIDLEYIGFKNDETKSVLTTFPTVTLSASENSNVGEYPIEITGASARNYSITYEPGILTVTKAEQTIEWVQDFTEVKVGDEVDLTAVASSGLAIEYTSSNSDVAEIDGSHIKFLGAGSVTITAIQSGDANYNEAQSVKKEISVSLLSSIDTINEDAVRVSVEHKKIVIHTLIDNLDISIYNINGKIDYRGNDKIISLPRGIYIVSVLGKKYKIIL